MTVELRAILRLFSRFQPDFVKKCLKKFNSQKITVLNIPVNCNFNGTSGYVRVFQTAFPRHYNTL